MKVIIDNNKEFKSLLNISEKCTSDLSGGSIAVKCVQLVCIKDPLNNHGKGLLKILAFKEGLCSFEGVMENVIISREGSLFIDKSTIHELLELIGLVESNNTLITLDKPPGKDLEIKIKDYGSRKLAVISTDDSGQEVKFPISGLNSINKDWKSVFKDNSGKLIEKFMKICPHVHKTDELIELRIEKIPEGANHYELSLNTRLIESNTLRYITHIQMTEEEYTTYVGMSFRISTKLKDIISIFKGGFQFSIAGTKDPIYRLSNTKGDTLTFFPGTVHITPSTQIDMSVKEGETICSLDLELNRFITALKFHMPEQTGGDALLSINKDFLNIKGGKSSSPAQIQLHSLSFYGKGWQNLSINTKPLISGGQSILNILASAGNIVMRVVPFKKNSIDISETHRVIILEPYAEFEGGSPTIQISAFIEELEDINTQDNSVLNNLEDSTTLNNDLIQITISE